MQLLTSNPTANESNDNDRNKFRRIPRSTSANRSDAEAIHAKSANSASAFSSV